MFERSPTGENNQQPNQVSHWCWGSESFKEIQRSVMLSFNQHIFIEHCVTYCGQ